MVIFISQIQITSNILKIKMKSKLKMIELEMDLDYFLTLEKVETREQENIL